MSKIIGVNSIVFNSSISLFFSSSDFSSGSEDLSVAPIIAMGRSQRQLFIVRKGRIEMSLCYIVVVNYVGKCILPNLSYYAIVFAL